MSLTLAGESSPLFVAAAVFFSDGPSGEDILPSRREARAS
jgi:hypothetical protein